MISSRNILVLTGTTTGGTFNMNVPYDLIIIGDPYVGSKISTLGLPLVSDLQPGYTLTIMDPYGNLNTALDNGCLLSANSNESAGVYINGKTFLYNIQPFNDRFGTYRITYEGSEGNDAFFTLINVNPSATKSVTRVDKYSLSQSFVSLDGNQTNHKGVGVATDGNQYSIIPASVAEVGNWIVKDNLIIIDMSVFTGATPSHVLFKLPNFDRDGIEHLTIGTSYKIMVANGDFGNYDTFFMVCSYRDQNTESGLYTPRIIAPNIKTFYNGNYFLQLTTGESAEFTWSGHDWIVTNINKQQYVQFNALPFNQLTTGNKNYANNYFETDLDLLT